MSASAQPVQRALVRQRRQQGHGSAPVGDLDGLALLDAAQQLAGCLAQLPHGHTHHSEHQLLAPTLLRSQLLSLLYQSVSRGEMTKQDAERQLDYVRGLRVRQLGDRVLQRAAWRVAEQLGWSDTLDAEYVALTQLQADASITLDARLAHAVRHLVTVAPVEALS